MESQARLEMALYTRGFVDAWARVRLSDGVVDSLAHVPRHLFVEPAARAHAYDVGEQPGVALPCNQVVSQAFMVGLIAELAGLENGGRVLDVGGGSGYQAAVLTELGAQVFSVEVRKELAIYGAARLNAAGYGDRVHTLVGDGRDGWPQHAPFDAIVAAACFDVIPRAWFKQLKLGGRIVVPLRDPNRPHGGAGAAVLTTLEVTEQGTRLVSAVPCRFVVAV